MHAEYKLTIERVARSEYKLTIERVARSEYKLILERVARNRYKLTIQRVARSHLSRITIQRVAQVDIQTRREKNLPHHGKAAAQRIREIQGPNIKVQGPQQIRINTQIRIVFAYLFVFGNTRPRIAVLQNYDGKDRVDRDFVGINKLFWSYLKQPGASIQNAVEMTKAFEYGKRAGDGMVNCAIEIARLEGKLVGMDTEAFTHLVGKARDNMYFTKSEYDSGPSGLALTGARFYAYYEMGEGVYLDAATLAALLPGKVKCPAGKIIYGAALEAALPQLHPKTELSKANKASKKKAKVAQQEARAEQAKREAAAAEAAKEARRFCKRCITCDKRFLREVPWEIHSAVCKARGGGGSPKQ